MGGVGSVGLMSRDHGLVLARPEFFHEFERHDGHRIRETPEPGDFL
jgi:hypothetical protein